MPPPKAIVTQSDMTRRFKAWKTVYGSDPVCRFLPDGTMELAPAEAAQPSDGDMTPLQKWKADNAAI